MLTSARGLLKADIIMGFDDIIIDSVNIDQVNGSTGSTSRWGPHVSGTESLTSGSRVLVPGVKKKKKRGKQGMKKRGRTLKK